MTQFDLKENAPSVLMALASLILAATFLLPVGRERRRLKTSYQGFAGYTGTFLVHSDSAPAVQQPAQLTVDPRRVQTPESREESAAHRRSGSARRRAAAGAVHKDAPGHRWPHLVSMVTPSRIETAIEKSSITVSTGNAAPVVAVAPLGPKTAAETADFVTEAYENDPAKYPLDRKAAQQQVSVRLCGLSRQKGRYILKVEVSNDGGDDFFVKEFSIRSGSGVLAAKSFFRLFVEPGRSREGFVVFDAPSSGADVHVVLKEDREKGRVITLPVPYPF